MLKIKISLPQVSSLGALLLVKNSCGCCYLLYLWLVLGKLEAMQVAKEVVVFNLAKDVTSTVRRMSCLTGQLF